MYVTYEYYAEEYGGKLIGEEAFSVMERTMLLWIIQKTKQKTKFRLPELLLEYI